MGMYLAFTVLGLLAAFGLLALCWLLLGRLLLPIPLNLTVSLTGHGDGEGLEQTLRHLRWLQGEKLAPFTPLVVDAGLSPQGLALVQALQRRDPTLLFCPAEEATYILQRKGDHGYFSL